VLEASNLQKNDHHAESDGQSQPPEEPMIGISGDASVLRKRTLTYIWVFFSGGNSSKFMPK